MESSAFKEISNRNKAIVCTEENKDDIIST